jgi:YHS domain-containing protein
MIRSVLILFFILVIYYAVKTVIRSAYRAYHHEEENSRARLKGDELVLDPQCRTYVVKGRATARRIRGKLYSFCSETCARQYEEKNQD